MRDKAIFLLTILATLLGYFSQDLAYFINDKTGLELGFSLVVIVIFIAGLYTFVQIKVNRKKEELGPSLTYLAYFNLMAGIFVVAKQIIILLFWFA